MAITKKAPKMVLAKGSEAEVEAKPEVKEKDATVEGVDMPESVKDLISETAYEVENLKEDRAFKLVPTLLNGIDKDYFKLGGVLSVIQSQGWYMDKNYENFRSYVESECGMAYRKSMYLIGIYNGLVASGVSWAQVGHLGWTKLKELAPILTTENVEEWVAIAESMTVLQLQEHIRAQSAGVEAGTADAPVGSEEAQDEAKKTTTMTFKVHVDQKETIRAALDKVKHETGTEFDAVALEHMALDYLSGDSTLKKIPTLAELMEGKSAEEVLTIFGEVFPEVALEATLPDDDA